MMGAYSAVSFGHITIRSSTLVMPGADQATRSASSRSIQERTVPFSITSLPFASTGDPIGFQLGISLEGFHDLALKLRGLDLGLHSDDVGHTLYALHFSHGV